MVQRTIIVNKMTVRHVVENQNNEISFVLNALGTSKVEIIGQKQSRKVKQARGV